MHPTEAHLILSLVSHLSARTLHLLREREVSLVRLVESPEEVREECPDLIDAKLADQIHEKTSSFDVAPLEKLCVQKLIRILCLEDSEYPSLLKCIYDPPLVLFVKGTLIPEDDAALAVVGARHASPYGIRVAHRLSYELAEAGVTVVSGMARGIDAEAHRGALDARGRTIAVLGSGVDVIYPRENERLYGKIAQMGAVISEFFPGTEPLPHHFPRRNRIISGLSLGTLVVEARAKSGSLITVSAALEQGREVFAVPGPIDLASSGGTNQLIREGATMVVSTADILSALELPLQNVLESGKTAKAPAQEERVEKKSSHFDLEERRLLEILGERQMTIDELMFESGYALENISQVLLQLEVKGVLRWLPGGFYEGMVESAVFV